MQRPLNFSKHEAERSITSRRRRPDGHLGFRQRQGQAEQRQALQGQMRKMIPGESDLVFNTATGELVKSNKQLYVDGCDGWGTNLRDRGVQTPVCKPLLSVGEYTTKG